MRAVPSPREPTPEPAVTSLPGTAVAHHDGTVIVHVSGSAEDLPRVAAVAWAIEDTGAFDQTVLHMGPESEVEAASAGLELPAAIQAVDADPGSRPRALQDALALVPCSLVILHTEGDAALAAAIAASRLGIGLAWIGDFQPEAAAASTRAVARLADLLFVHGDEDAAALSALGAPERIHVVGNPLIDTVRRFTRDAARRSLSGAARPVLAILTDGAVAAKLDPGLAALAARFPLSIVEAAPGVPPLLRSRAAGAIALRAAGFVERLALERVAGAIITDSRRVQEEAAALGVRCYAVASAQGRVCVEAGGTTLELGDDPAAVAQVRPAAHPRTPCAIPYWDGRAGRRVAAVVVANFARVSFAS